MRLNNLLSYDASKKWRRLGLNLQPIQIQTHIATAPPGIKTAKARFVTTAISMQLTGLQARYNWKWESQDGVIFVADPETSKNSPFLTRTS